MATWDETQQAIVRAAEQASDPEDVRKALIKATLFAGSSPQLSELLQFALELTTTTKVR